MEKELELQNKKLELIQWLSTIEDINSENEDSYDVDFVKKVLDAGKGTFTRVKKDNLKSFIQSL